MEKYLTEDEVYRLISVELESEKKLLILMGLDMGCRVSEIVNLPLRRIRNRIIEIWDEKKDKMRTCVISFDTAMMLSDHMSKQMHKRGYRNNAKKVFYVSSRTVNNWLKVIFQQAEIPREKAHWHTLRHTYIRRAMAAGHNLRSICDQTGDTPETILRHYGELTVDDRLNQMDQKPLLPIRGDDLE